ncbi:MAG: sigma 54-interacting transcriptional regulator [Bryobacteraceae bacterium]|nr:sigma 54-interacting transcriptional regulator [Bryobacteraceae bacterium]
MSRLLADGSEDRYWMIAEGKARSYELVGQSARLRNVLRLASKLGRGNWPVLLLGETGTGKELVARTIHRSGPGGPFVTIDCSSMVGPLMESELFGHVKGAFTGAHSNKIGLIEQANGGTAFFDEIGELPLDLQAKLLRVLQEKEFRPVGSLQVRKSSFRIIAATNRDLAKEVEKGRFRQDLYYRLNVVTLRLSPLRERKEDLPALIRHFLELYGNGHTISGELLELMMAYDWPGNVRELENCIQHMVAINSGPVLHLHDAPSQLLHFHEQRRRPSGNFLQAAAAAAPPGAEGGEASDSFVTPVLPLAEMERRAIINALRYTKGDRVMAAHLLGIGRTTLYRKIKEYGIRD